MDFTPFEIVTNLRFLQKANAILPIDFTLPGIVTDVRPGQPANAYSPITLTLFGIVYELLCFAGGYCIRVSC
ncbi:MAG: hypothetical protein FWB85_06440, partial [Chitinispirillia bacterium]|nr:hypothetical protein [Chitinispirillia bacterium]MCL2241861.1 hypothetical protein [Chitinispirillia bacterium]